MLFRSGAGLNLSALNHIAVWKGRLFCLNPTFMTVERGNDVALFNGLAAIFQQVKVAEKERGFPVDKGTVDAQGENFVVGVIWDRHSDDLGVTDHGEYVESVELALASADEAS